MTNPAITDAVDPQSLSGFDMVIDVRSPAEFAEDHVPGAVNLPVLDNDERATVGTIYVQDSRFRARKVGAALVAKNVANHLQTALADMPGSFQPLVYCWRGGQRSNSMAIILAQVGWRTTVLSGGYKTYRRWAQTKLYEAELPLKLVLLDGGTGVGKTAMLERLARMGAQTIDLEALAQHRGSLFGGLPGQAQPSQKMFESRLLAQLDALDPARPVVVEAESSKVGARILPPALWARMMAAPRVELTAPRAERARFLVEAYDDIVRDARALDTALRKLPEYPGKKRLEEWRALAEAGEFAALAEAVIERHYDPAYARSRRMDRHELLGTVDLAALDEGGQQAAAESVVQVIKDAFGGI